MLARYKTHCSVGKFCHLNLFSQLYASVTVCSLSFLGLWFLEAGSSADSQGKIILIRACFDVAYFFCKGRKRLFLKEGNGEEDRNKDYFFFSCCQCFCQFKMRVPGSVSVSLTKNKKDACKHLNFLTNSALRAKERNRAKLFESAKFAKMEPWLSATIES